MTAKGSFLAPSHQRIEGDEKAERYNDMVIIADYETAKGLVLLPKQKIAVVIDSEKIKDQINNPMTYMFETMRCLVREGRSRSGQQVAPIGGEREIDGQKVVGFLAHSSMGDMTLWANPQTAKPVRIELDMPAMKAHGVLSNFRYDVELDPSLVQPRTTAGLSDPDDECRVAFGERVDRNLACRGRTERRHVPEETRHEQRSHGRSASDRGARHRRHCDVRATRKPRRPSWRPRRSRKSTCRGFCSTCR